MMEETNAITIECDNNHNADNISTLPTGTSTTSEDRTEEQVTKAQDNEQGTIQEFLTYHHTSHRLLFISHLLLFIFIYLIRHSLPPPPLTH